MESGWALALALASSPFLEPPASDPDPHARDASAAQTSVKVLVSDDEQDDLVDALGAAQTKLRRDGVELEPVVLPEGVPADRATARAIAKEASAQGVFWFDASDPEQVGVFLVAEDGSTFVRRVPVDPASPQASLEAVWLIVESSARALAVGTTPSMERLSFEPPPVETEPEPSQPAVVEPAPPPEATRPEPAQDPKARVRPGLVVAYFGESFATNVAWQSGAVVGFELDIGPWPRLGVEYRFVSPWPVGDPAVTWRHGATVHVGIHRSFGARFELAPRVSGGVDLVHWSGRDERDGVRAMATVGADLGLGIRLVADLHLVVAPGVAVVINRFAFIECDANATMCEGPARRVRTDPWRVRPRARLGFAYRF